MKNNTYINNLDGKTSTLIIISKKYGTHHVIVDNDDVPYLKSRLWSISTKNNKISIRAQLNCKKIYIHNFIAIHNNIIVPKNYSLDHIDNNPLNNSKSNLRIASPAQQNFNKSLSKSNNSGWKGVYRKHNKFYAQITHNNKKIHLGSFNCPIIAHIHYRKKSIELFGQFANFGYKIGSVRDNIVKNILLEINDNN